MKTINANTKIATLLKQNPDALEAIISISPKFNKLRNPLLRKLMAARTSINMASKVGGCTTNDFFKKMEPLGFTIDKNIVADDNTAQKQVPEFVQNIAVANIVELDVRTEIESGKDPLNLILKAVKPLQPGQMLKLINSFEPVPLMLLLEKQGFETYAEVINNNLVNTYFYKKTESTLLKTEVTANSSDWDVVIKRYDGKLKTIDVRTMEMPLPMHTILESLNKLPEDQALFVYHKRIPVFLLPELEDQHFSYRIKEISDGEVHLLIYKN